MASTHLQHANTRFALCLYRQLLAKDPSANLFFAPASISVAMAMTYLGARNQTADEMKMAMSFDLIAEDELHSGFAGLCSALGSDAGSKHTLHLANRLFADKTFVMVEDFVHDTKMHYKAEVAAVDFRSNAEGARQEINNWVEGKTAKKIRNLIGEGVLNSLTALVLVNAIYFKGNWSSQFKLEETAEDVFHVSKERIVNVQMMFQKAKFNLGYNDGLKCQILELPYIGNEMSMFVLLPKENDGLATLEEVLTDEILLKVDLSFHMHNSETYVWLPRFKMEESFQLNEALASLGMVKIFDQASSDLSGIDSRNNIYVSKVLHKAFLEVNEEGSEAAAATAVVTMYRCAPIRHEFKANHPFLFFIRQNATGSILFLGRYYEP